MPGGVFALPPYEDIVGLRSHNSMFGEVVTASRRDLVSAHFRHGLPSQVFQRVQRWNFAITLGVFNANERIVGTTSGAIGILETTTSPVRIRVLSGAFTSPETITGIGVTATASGATGVITASVATNGDQVVTNSVLALSSGTNATGDNALEAAQSMTYAPGHELGAFFTAAWDVPNMVAGMDAYVGAFTRGGTDGYGVGYHDGAFGLVVRKGGVPSYTAASAFNIDKMDGTGPSAATPNPAMLNAFGMKTAFLGVVGLMLYFMDTSGKWWPAHFQTRVNAGLTTIINDPHLTVRMDITKTAAGATNGTVYSASWNGYTAGPTMRESTRQRVNSASRLATAYVNGAERHAITILNKLTYAGNENKTTIRLTGIAVSSDGSAANHIFVQIRRNSPVTVTTFTDVDALDSSVSTSVLATTGFTSGDVEFAFSATGQSGDPIPLEDAQLILQPGESYTITFFPTSNQTADMNVRWREEN